MRLSRNIEWLFWQLAIVIFSENAKPLKIDFVETVCIPMSVQMFYIFAGNEKLRQALKTNVDSKIKVGPAESGLHWVIKTIDKRNRSQLKVLIIPMSEPQRVSRTFLSVIEWSKYGENKRIMKFDHRRKLLNNLQLRQINAERNNTLRQIALPWCSRSFPKLCLLRRGRLAHIWPASISYWPIILPWMELTSANPTDGLAKHVATTWLKIREWDWFKNGLAANGADWTATSQSAQSGQIQRLSTALMCVTWVSSDSCPNNFQWTW